MSKMSRFLNVCTNLSTVGIKNWRYPGIKLLGHYFQKNFKSKEMFIQVLTVPGYAVSYIFLMKTFSVWLFTKKLLKAY